MKSIQPSHWPQTAFSFPNLNFQTTPKPNAILHPSRLWDGHTGASPLPCIQISHEFSDIGAVGLVECQ